jgi:hypothetical protein
LKDREGHVSQHVLSLKEPTLTALTKLDLIDAQITVAADSGPFALMILTQEASGTVKRILGTAQVGRLRVGRALEPIRTSRRKVNDRQDPALHQLDVTWTENAGVFFDEPGCG